MAIQTKKARVSISKAWNRVQPSASARTGGQVDSGGGYFDNGGTFSDILRRLFFRSGISLTLLSRRSWLDIGYVSRLISQDHDPLNPPLRPEGKAKQPSRDAIIRIGIAMGLALEDIDELLMAAAYAPLIR
jgi:hypothetical protein